MILISMDVFNIALAYSWNFAPGSFLKLMGKYNIVESQKIENNSFNEL